MKRNESTGDILRKLTQVQLQLAQLSIEKDELETRLQNRLKQTGEGKPQQSAPRNRGRNNGKSAGGKKFRDRDGTEIQIGDNVITLTAGKYDSRQGKVVSFSKHRVRFIDTNNRYQEREPRNLQVVDEDYKW